MFKVVVLNLVDELAKQFWKPWWPGPTLETDMIRLEYSLGTGGGSTVHPVSRTSLRKTPSISKKESSP